MPDFDHKAYLEDIKNRWSAFACEDMKYVLGRLEGAETAARRTHFINKEMIAFLLKLRKGPQCWCFLADNDPGAVGHTEACTYFRRLIYKKDE